MPIWVAADCPSQASSSSTTIRSPVAAAPAATSPVTIAISSIPSVLRRAPSTSENIACTSERRPPEASDSARRCLARSKLLIGTMASVRMTYPATLTVETRGVVEGFPGEAHSGRRVAHQGGGDEGGRPVRVLVGDESVDHALVGAHDPLGAVLVAGAVHEGVGRALDRFAAAERAHRDDGRRALGQRLLHPWHREDRADRDDRVRGAD